MTGTATFDARRRNPSQEAPGGGRTDRDVEFSMENGDLIYLSWDPQIAAVYDNGTTVHVGECFQRHKCLCKELG